MQNDLALFEDIDDAMVGVVTALGGPKKIGSMLRPDLAHRPEACSQWVRDCLNPEKRERFSPQQIFRLLRLARDAGYHAAKHWIDCELGYEPSKPIEPHDELVTLQRQFINSVAEQRRMVERIERLTQTPLQAVR